MKVKELIKKLKDMDPEANVVSQEYTGCNHTIHDVDQVTFIDVNGKVPGWDDSSNSKAVNDKGFCKTKVVYIN